MAPVAALGRAAVLDLLEQGRLPFELGSPHPHVMILVQDGKFRIRGLVVDPVESHAARTEALAGDGIWMPEHHYALGKPTGEIFVEADSRDALIARIKMMTWPDEW